MKSYKAIFRIYELEGINEEYEKENLTLAILTQVDSSSRDLNGFRKNTNKDDNMFDFDTFHHLLLKRFGDGLFCHCHLESEETFFLSDKTNVSESYLNKIMREIITLLRGVEIFVVDRNLGYLRDVPVFDKRQEEKLAEQKTNCWVLMSDIDSIGGEETYNSCPELIPFIKEGFNGCDNLITYTKKTPQAVYVGVEFSKLISQQNESLRYNKLTKPRRIEELREALNHLVKAIKSNS